MCIACVAVASLPLIIGSPAVPNEHTRIFNEPIDALSVRMDSASARATVRGFDGTTWTSWQELAVDSEQDPKSRESNLVTFPKRVEKVEIRSASNVELHPITVSHAPAHYDVAVVAGNSTAPSILTREQWGADESLRVTEAHPTPAQVEEATKNKHDNGNGDTATNKRVEECNAAVRDHPDEFRTVRTIRHIGSSPLLWPQQYSKEVKMLVVHHTAQKVMGDARPGVERMRAIYQYHAVSKRWGDIGYNYVIDEAGQIYEGRAGGDNVVAGHAYCNNVGTLGIAMMGNFEEEEPTQAQVKALQWLLRELADKHDIDLERSVNFHGKTRSPISVHGDLLSTSCPGFYLHGAMDQVRAHVLSNDTNASVSFPVKPTRITTTDKPRVDRTAERRAQRQSSAVQQLREGLYAVTPVELTGNPGQEVLVSVKYIAGTDGAKRGKVIGAITRSEDDIGMWLDRNGTYERLRTSLTLPEALGAWEALTMQFKISFPLKEGTSTVRIGTVTYTLQASGRRMRVPTERIPEVTSTRSTLRRETVTRPSSLSFQSSQSSQSSRSSLSSLSSQSSLSSRSSQSSQSSLSSTPSRVSPGIRIRLSFPADQSSAAIQSPDTESSTVRVDGKDCVQTQYGEVIARGVVRIVVGSFTITNWKHLQNRFRGTLECRVIDGKLALINELPLEDYMKGLAEEPDTELFEKQKAFAIAARSYAMHYMGSTYRKFPGLPYDGTDSPGNFQKYGGLEFEMAHAQWVRAVNETSSQVLTKDGEVIRAPYFHSDDGRTRSPLELGWTSFPHAAIYSSKPDPWCEGEGMAGHGVGMSGCGAKGLAKEGKTYTEILQYYYPGAAIERK